MDNQDDEDAVFQGLVDAGKKVKPDLWLPGDLDTLRAIAGDVVGLNAKAKVALAGDPGHTQVVNDPPGPHLNPPGPVINNPRFPITVRNPGIRGPVFNDPIMRRQMMVRPVSEIEPARLAALTAVAPNLVHTHTIVVDVVPPDPSKAAMYTAAANRALDAAANLVVIRVQALPGTVDQVKQSFLTAVWAGLGSMLTGIKPS